MLLISLAAALLILSIKTGLILGASWLKMERISVSAALFGSLVIILSYIFKDQYQLIGQFIDNYTFTFACITGLLFLYLGMSHTAATETPGKKQKITYWLSFLPCPFCVGALVVSVIYTAGGLQYPWFYVAVSTGLLFAGGIIAVSWILRKFFKRFKWNINNLFHEGLLFLGIFTLLSAFLIPNIVATMQDTFVPVVLCSRQEFFLAAGGFFILFLLGLGKEILTSSYTILRRR